VLVATQGQGDEDALEAALRSPAGHVLMIASRRKADALRETMRGRGVDETALARLQAPAGPDAGAKTPGEIALVAMVGCWGCCVGERLRLRRRDRSGLAAHVRQPGVRDDGERRCGDACGDVRGRGVLLLLRRMLDDIPAGSGAVRGDSSGAVTAWLRRSRLATPSLPSEAGPGRARASPRGIWEVKDMDAAVARVKRCPNPMPGPSEIEIRPLYEVADAMRS
jgi:hypothetical protein